MAILLWPFLYCKSDHCKPVALHQLHILSLDGCCLNRVPNTPGIHQQFCCPACIKQQDSVQHLTHNSGASEVFPVGQIAHDPGDFVGINRQCAVCSQSERQDENIKELDPGRGCGFVISN